MKRKVVMQGVDFSPDLDDELELHIKDIAQFAAENGSVVINLSQVKNKRFLYQAKIQVHCNMGSFQATTEGKQLFQILSDSKKKVLAQLISSQKQKKFKRRREKAKFNQNEKYKVA